MHFLIDWMILMMRRRKRELLFVERAIVWLCRHSAEGAQHRGAVDVSRVQPAHVRLDVLATAEQRAGEPWRAGVGVARRCGPRRRHLANLLPRDGDGGRRGGAHALRTVPWRTRPRRRQRHNYRWCWPAGAVVVVSCRVCLPLPCRSLSAVRCALVRSSRCALQPKSTLHTLYGLHCTILYLQPNKSIHVSASKTIQLENLQNYIHCKQRQQVRR